jgi:PAS domain S-box-containing protein
LKHLRSSEEKYREIVKMSAMLSTLLTTKVFTSIPPVKLTGYSQNEIVGKHLIDFVSPEWKDRVTEFYFKI